MAKDPVCGMEVQPQQAPAKAQYNGKEYLFCSVGCKQAFDQNPARYVKQPASSSTHA